MTEPENTITEAISFGLEYGQTDGAHHKMWVIDRMIRILAGPDYDRIISDHEEEYFWDTGIAP